MILVDRRLRPGGVVLPWSPVFMLAAGMLGRDAVYVWDVGFTFHPDSDVLRAYACFPLTTLDAGNLITVCMPWGLLIGYFAVCVARFFSSRGRAVVHSLLRREGFGACMVAPGNPKDHCDWVQAWPITAHTSDPVSYTHLRAHET